MRNVFEADYVLHREVTVSCPLEKVFDFFSKAENLEMLTPPWLRFRIETLHPIQMRQGATIAYRLHVRGVPLRWLTEIELWRPPYEFVDVQVKGPYKLWRHIHRFQESKDGTRIVDVVNYTLFRAVRRAHRGGRGLDFSAGANGIVRSRQGDYGPAHRGTPRHCL